jgi:phytoene dehydrogenase-like protein
VNDAVVVGGGLAGITAALDLADAGKRVTLLEARPRLGGATFSVERDGLWIDNGQHIFLRCCVEYRALLDRLGVTGETTLQDRLALPILRPGGKLSYLRRAPLPPPFHFAPSFARFGALSLRDRVKLLRPALELQRASLDDPSLDEQTKRPRDQCDVGSLRPADAQPACVGSVARARGNGLQDRDARRGGRV